MKCPNCGTELKEGTFYCENCGHDIHIVPDFEPELELNLEKSFEQIREDVGGQKDRDGAEDPEDDREAGDGSGKKINFRKIYFLLWGLVGLLAAALVVGGIRIYQSHSVKYQVKKAAQAVQNRQYDRAVGYYTRALELDRYNIELKFDLAEVYFLKNNKVEYEYLLTDIIYDPYTDAEQLESAYGKLIAIYKAREDYRTINELLTKCGSESVRSAYQGYLVQPPEFSTPGGTYNSMTALKLAAPGKGSIYYTVNGDDPDENSGQYTAPILLEKGRYVVKALFVNENGVASEVASAEYWIEAEELEMPEINVDSGDYSIPILITVFNDEEDIYYTVDGSDPTINSQQYTEPIPMPLGVSHFRFVRLQAGQSSAVADRIFQLELRTDFTVEQALDKIVNYQLQTGKIADAAGHFDDTGAVYRYQFLYAANINDIGDFYVIAEVLADTQGGLARTGNYYAVNAYTGYYYKLQIENGTYMLTEIG